VRINKISLSTDPFRKTENVKWELTDLKHLVTYENGAKQNG
jgi:hypothetical protein